MVPLQLCRGAKLKSWHLLRVQVRGVDGGDQTSSLERHVLSLRTRRPADFEHLVLRGIQGEVGVRAQSLSGPVWREGAHFLRSKTTARFGSKGQNFLRAVSGVGGCKPPCERILIQSIDHQHAKLS